MKGFRSKKTRFWRAGAKAAVATAVAVAGALSVATPGVAAPGDIVFADNFDAGAVSCSALSPNWSGSVGNFTGVGTFTANSGSCALFTRGGVVTVASRTFDLSSASGADLTFWLRKGSDAFSEDPDETEASLVLEYRTSGGGWTELRTFDAPTLTPGQVVNVSETIPFDGLHGAAQVRFRQLGGSGGPPSNNGIGWDYWHIDDVQVLETGIAPPSPNITANSCDDFENGLLNWTRSDNSRIGVNGDTFNSSNNSLYLRHDTATATMASIDARSLSQISIWVRRGADSFSENPDSGENLSVQYLDSNGAWVTLETFAGGGAQGQIFNRTYPAVAAMRHAGFRLRLFYARGSGSDFDYWHVDDVCFTSASPTITVTKSVEIESDPVNGTTNPLAIPGAIVRYTVRVTNAGAGFVDADTLVITDMLDPNTTLFSGNVDGSGAPVVFTDGGGGDASGVNLVYAGLGSGSDGIEFLTAGGAAVTPGADFDPQVAQLRLLLDGAMNGAASGGSPTFTVEYLARLN